MARRRLNPADQRENPVMNRVEPGQELFDLTRPVLVSENTQRSIDAKWRAMAGASRARRKGFILAKNARCIEGNIPDYDGGLLYGLIPGNFRYGELVPIIMMGNHLPNIAELHSKENVIAGALAYFQQVSQLSEDVHRGMQIEMLRDIARRASEIGDFASALKAVSQLSSLTK